MLLPPYNLLGMDTMLLGCAAFHVLVCVHACVCAVSWCTKAIEESSSSMPIECVLGGGHFAPVTFDRQQVSSNIGNPSYIGNLPYTSRIMVWAQLEIGAMTYTRTSADMRQRGRACYAYRVYWAARIGMVMMLKGRYLPIATCEQVCQRQHVARATVTISHSARTT